MNPRRTVRKENRIRPKVHGLLRALGTCAAIVLAAAWFGGTLPFDPLQTLDPSGSVRLRDTLPVIEADLSALPDAARIQVVDGYEVGEALPYTLGFLALMVALGLLNRDGWTRLWGPLLAVASGWLWLDVFGGVEQLAAALVLCTLVGFCTLVAPSSRQLSYS